MDNIDPKGWFIFGLPPAFRLPNSYAPPPKPPCTVCGGWQIEDGTTPDEVFIGVVDEGVR